MIKVARGFGDLSENSEWFIRALPKGESSLMMPCMASASWLPTILKLRLLPPATAVTVGRHMRPGGGRAPIRKIERTEAT